jgi:hypothetical protein
MSFWGTKKDVEGTTEVAGTQMPGPSVSVKIKPVAGTSRGVFEVTVKTNDHEGTTVVRTSPRQFAFQRA